jgi:hypothetical protein
LLSLQKAAGNAAVSDLITGGAPLPPALRRDMEQRFGCDFSAVRIHEGSRAEAATKSLSAKAVTIGQHIVFDARRFAPDTSDGRRLIAHELAHVVQQSRGGSTPPSTNGSGPLESDADRAGQAATDGTGPIAVSGSSSVGPACALAPLTAYDDETLAKQLADVGERLKQPAYSGRDRDVDEQMALNSEIQRRERAAAVTKASAEPAPKEEAYKPAAQFLPGGFTNEQIIRVAGVDPDFYGDPKAKETAEEAQGKAKEAEDDATRIDRLLQVRSIMAQKHYLPEDVRDIMDRYLSMRDMLVLKRFGFKYPTNLLTRYKVRTRLIDAIDEYNKAWQAQHQGTEKNEVNRRADDFQAIVDADTARARSLYNPAVAEAVTGGPFGAIGYGIGGDRGALLGASLDNMLYALGGMMEAKAGMPQAEPWQDPITDVRPVEQSAPETPRPADPTSDVQAAEPPVVAEPPVQSPPAPTTPTPAPKPLITAHADQGGVVLNEVKPADVTPVRPSNPAAKPVTVETTPPPTGQRRYVPAPKPQPKPKGTTTPPPKGKGAFRGKKGRPEITAQPTQPPPPPSGFEDIFEQVGQTERKTLGTKPVNPRTEAGQFGHKHYEQLDDLLNDFASEADPFVDDIPKGAHVEKEFAIPHPDYDSPPRVDRVDWDRAEIFEIKPDSPEWIAQGQAEAQQYVQWMNKYVKRPDGKVWKLGGNKGVATYPSNALEAWLRKKGYLP